MGVLGGSDLWALGVSTAGFLAGLVNSVFTRTGHVAATGGDYTAALITNTPAGAIAAVTVQAAINELDTDKAALAGATFGGAVQMPTGSGVGVAATDGMFHIQTITAGAVTADANANQLVIETNVAGGISILVTDGAAAGVFFGSPSNNAAARIQHTWSANALTIATADVGHSVVLSADNQVPNLTLSGAAGSELAAFVKNVTIGGTLTAGSPTFTIDAIGITITDGTDDLSLLNTTAASVGAQQFSPAFRQQGSGWETNVGSSMTVEFRSYVQTVQGAAAPIGLWTLEASIDGGAYAGVLTADSNGTLTTTGIIRAAAGSSIGLAHTDGTLHVHTASAGAVSPDTASDDLVVENDDHCGIAMLAPDDKQITLAFASPSSNVGANINWNYGTGAFNFGSNKVGAVATFRTDNNVVALTLSGAAAAELAVFPRNVTVTGTLSGTINATGGASFGPADITTITVVNGIVTAIA